MTIEITLPRAMTCANLEQMLPQMQAIRDSDTDLIVDCSKLTFVDPCGLTLLASSLEFPHTSNQRIRFDYLGVAICNYLQRMNFFSHFDSIEGVDLRLNNRNDRRGYLCELTKISEENEAEDAVETLAWAATGTIQTENNHDDEDVMSLFYPIKYALSELVENAVTHAKRDGYFSASVWVAAQYYPNTGSVKIAVTDNGCGFLNTLKTHPSLGAEATHTAAITAALQPRVSCNRNLIPLGLSENQGVGLTTTARIAKRADGGITIFSGNGLHNDTPTTRSVKRSQKCRPMAPHWQGVGVVVDLDRQNLSGIKIHELLPDDEPLITNQNGPMPNINFL